MKSGHVRWPQDDPVWEFDYVLADAPDTEGTAFQHVFYRGRKVFFKASLPMIRVHYDNGVSYKDALCANNMTSFQVYEGVICGGRTGGVFGLNFYYLVVDASHRIGQYRLTNRWIFRQDGIILPQLYSAGLQHPVNHRHHVYWRFDFDIDGSAQNLAFLRAESWPQDWGYGPAWYPVTHEERFRKDDRDKLWAVYNKASQLGYFIAPGRFDGKDDSFARGDVWVLHYHDEEDLRGRLGSPAADDLRKHLNGENTDGQDIVMWYVAHLNHVAHDHGDEWHVCGPTLQPFRY